MGSMVNGKTYALPKGEENDQLDAQHFQKRPVLGQILLELDVELDEAEHGDGDRDGLEDLHPDVGVDGRQAVLAVDVEVLGQHRDDGEEDADEAVLEHADPDDLVSQSVWPDPPPSDPHDSH